MKEFVAEHSVKIAIAVIIPAVGLCIERRHRKKVEEDRRLKAHFVDLKKEADPIISAVSSISKSYGKVNIGETQISGSFKAHFPGEAEMWSSLNDRVNVHNRKCENFRQKIEIAFESKGIPVVKSWDTVCNSAYVNEKMLYALFLFWEALARGCEGALTTLPIKFQQEEGRNGYFLFVGSTALKSVAAFAPNDDDKKDCEDALDKVANGEENKNGAFELFDCAGKIIGGVTEFGEQLKNKVEKVAKFWPGTKEYRFKKLKKTCPFCKELF